MSTIDELVPLLKKLRLSGVLQSLELRLQQAEKTVCRTRSLCFDSSPTRSNDATASNWSSESVARTSSARQDAGRLRLHFNPNVPKARVIDLATCSFVEKRQSVLLLGPAGVGKSHIAQALGHRACRLGKACSMSLPKTSSSNSALPAQTAPMTAACCASPRPIC